MEVESLEVSKPCVRCGKAELAIHICRPSDGYVRMLDFVRRIANTEHEQLTRSVAITIHGHASDLLVELGENE